MPNPNALWIVTTAADSAPAEQVADLNEVLSTGGVSIMGGSGRLGQAVSIEFPEFKVSRTLFSFWRIWDGWRGAGELGGRVRGASSSSGSDWAQSYICCPRELPAVTWTTGEGWVMRGAGNSSLASSCIELRWDQSGDEPS